MSEASISVDPRALELELEQHRRELTAYCYRMLASPFEAEDAVQETFLRAWRGIESFRGPQRAPLLALPHRDERLSRHAERSRAPRPADGPRAGARARAANLNTLPETTWIEPIPDALVDVRSDPAEVAVARDTIRRVRRRAPAPAAAAARRARPLRGAPLEGGEVAELLETSVASVNSALQRARARRSKQLELTTATAT